MTGRRPIAHFALAGATACASLALAACGGNDEGTTSAASSSTTAPGATGPTGQHPKPVPEQAHIDPSTGSSKGLKPDGREGTEPPPVAEDDLEPAANAAGCKLQLNLPDEGNKHLAPGAPEPDYETDPPTSGPHDPTPIADGAYRSTPDPVNFVLSLEHGRIEIQYSPELPEADQLLLKGIFDEDPDGVLLFPNPDMPYEVAVTAWTRLAGCASYDESVFDVVRDFRDQFRGKGPEKIQI